MSGASVWGNATQIPSTANADNTYKSQQFTATAGQTLFTLTNFAYQVGTGSLLVYVNGVDQYIGTDFTETSNSSVTLVTAAEAGDLVVIRGLIGSTGASNAADSAADAQNSAIAAAASATAAAGSATASANSATASAASATAAATSETNAATSATAAATSATAAANTANTISGGATALRYLFSTTASGDPATGYIRLNNATQNLATLVKVNLVDGNGQDLTSLLNSLDDSDSLASKGQFRLVKRDDVTAWITFNITAMTSPAGHREYTVTVTASSAASPFANDDPVILAWTRTGDQGDGVTLVQTPRASNIQIVQADNAKVFELTGTFTQTFDTAANLGNGWWCEIQNVGTGDITVTLDGLTYKIYPKEHRRVMSNGTSLTTKILHGYRKVFTSTDTYTKPAGYTVHGGMIKGTGCSGGRDSTGARGGAGGGSFPFELPDSIIGATETVTIGAGGAVVTGTQATGNAGGNTSFGALLVVGPNGTTNGGSIRINNNPPNATATPTGFEGAANGTSPQPAIYGGGTSSSSFNAPSSGSLYGGGAGGSVDGAGNLQTAGNSAFSGDGGAAGNATNGTAGVDPCGGGGATRTGTQSGPGGRGEVEIWGVV